MAAGPVTERNQGYYCNIICIYIYLFILLNNNIYTKNYLKNTYFVFFRYWNIKNISLKYIKLINQYN